LLYGDACLSTLAQIGHVCIRVSCSPKHAYNLDAQSGLFIVNAPLFFGAFSLGGIVTTAVLDLEQLNTQFETAHPQDILAWAADTYGEGFAVVTSFQPTGIVTLHMLQDIAPRTPILTLDTGLLFPETYALMDHLEAAWELNLTRVRPAQTVAQQAERHGAELWANDPDLCCNLRKVVPLCDALTGYEAWVTGLRRDQGGKRAHTPIISWDAKHGKVKLSPLATWTEDMIWMYIESYELPYNALHDQQYPSIGCSPCTHPVSLDSLDQRGGRWAGHTKTECGIHFTQ